VRFCFIIPALCLAFAGCQSTLARPVPGTPEYAAFMTSRGYDCGLNVERGRVLAAQAERAAYVRAGQAYAVRAYNKPEACGSFERAEVMAELKRLARR
jgi:hypothetical protein